MVSVTNIEKKKTKSKPDGLFLFFSLLQFLYVYGVLHLETLQLRRFVKLLTATEFFYNTGLFILSLEFLKGALYVLTLFNWNNDHFKLFVFI